MRPKLWLMLHIPTSQPSLALPLGHGGLPEYRAEAGRSPLKGFDPRAWGHGSALNVLGSVHSWDQASYVGALGSIPNTVPSMTRSHP